MPQWVRITTYRRRAGMEVINVSVCLDQYNHCLRAGGQGFNSHCRLQFLVLIVWNGDDCLLEFRAVFMLVAMTTSNLRIFLPDTPPSPSSSQDRVWSLSSVLLCEGARFSWCSAKVCECVELCLRILYKCFRVVLRHVNSLNGCECWALPGLSLWKCRMVRTGWGVRNDTTLNFSGLMFLLDAVVFGGCWSKIVWTITSANQNQN